MCWWGLSGTAPVPITYVFSVYSLKPEAYRSQTAMARKYAVGGKLLQKWAGPLAQSTATRQRSRPRRDECRLAQVPKLLTTESRNNKHKGHSVCVLLLRSSKRICRCLFSEKDLWLPSLQLLKADNLWHLWLCFPLSWPTRVPAGLGKPAQGG